VRTLLGAPGLDVNRTRSDGCTALFMASQNGHTSVARLLLTAADVEIEKPGLPNMFTPLIIAAYKGRHAAVTALLGGKANINARTSEGYTALAIAVDRHDPVLHATLLMHGADAHGLHSELFCACLRGTVASARAALARSGSSGSSKDARLSPVHIACIQGNVTDARAALSAASTHGSSGWADAACARDASGLSPLYYAAELGKFEVVRLLLEAIGVPSNVVERTGEAVRLSNQYVLQGRSFFKTIVLPFVEERIYVDYDGAKKLLIAYLGSVAAARFFARDTNAFKTLHTLAVRGLREIQLRLETVFLGEGLAEILGTLGNDVSERIGGGRQDDPDLLPKFPETLGYGPTATFYEDDYIDALQMLSCALDPAFFQRVQDALSGTVCTLRHPSIKSRTRMRNKLGDPDDHLGKARPRPAHNIDTMRCAATFADADGLVRGYHALVKVFGTPVRVKNSFHEEFNPSKSYGYRSVLVNLRFDTHVTFEEVFGAANGAAGIASDWDTIGECQSSRETGLAYQRILRDWFRHAAVLPMRVAMAAEVQLILAPYLRARKESHLLYKVVRCNKAEALVSDAAVSGDGPVEASNCEALEAATQRMQRQVADLIEHRTAAFDTMDAIELDAQG